MTKVCFYLNLSLMHFSDRLAGVIKDKNSCLMLGLDPNWEKLPPALTEGLSPQLEKKESRQKKADIFENFCTNMVNACAEFVCGIKIQMGYFEALGSVGVKAVENIIGYTRLNHPELIIMMDAKRGDIGSTSTAYAQAFLGAESPLSGDCVTVAPYMGSDSVGAFLGAGAKNKSGVFVLVKTSNPSAKEMQDIEVLNSEKNTAHLRKLFSESYKSREGIRISEITAMQVNAVEKNVLEERLADNNYSFVGAVVGATNEGELAKFRELMPKIWMLCPGVGAQGGKIDDVLKIRDEEGLGVLIPVSRSVLYASSGEDYLKAARAEIEGLWEAQKI